MHLNYDKQNTMFIVNYHSESGNLTNSNHHWHTVVTAPHSILAIVIGLFIWLRSWTMKVQPTGSKRYSSNFKLQSPNFQGLEGSWLSHVYCPMSIVCYILCVDFLKSLQSSVFTQLLSTAVSTHLHKPTYTTASFHLGKFGDDRYSS